MDPFVIDRNKWDTIRLVDSSGQFHDPVSMIEARKMAKDNELDLVCFSLPETDKLALCKIIDFGKWKYRQEKEKKKERSHNKTEIKEVRFTPAIFDNDLLHKIKQINGFLEEGDDVIITMRFWGIHKRMVAEGDRIMAQISEMTKEFGEEVSRKKSGDQVMIRLKKRHKKNKVEIKK